MCFSGHGNNGFFYDESSYFADPPPATSWPAPKPEYQAQAWQHQQNEDQDDPVPGWAIQAEDDEPPDIEVVEENLAMARLQYKGQENTLVQVSLFLKQKCYRVLECFYNNGPQCKFV